MSKWISDAYIKRLMKNNRLLQGNCEYELYKQDVDRQVDAMPSIDIVRCKECVFADQYYHCNYMTTWNNPDDFCSYGERREP